MDSDSRSAVPDNLKLVQDFINTIDLEVGQDQFCDPLSLSAWMAGEGLMDSSDVATNSDLRQAIALREALRSLVLANNGGSLPDVALKALNRLAGSEHLCLRFDPAGRAQLVSRSSGVRGALDRLVSIVYASMLTGTWSRLKACRADDCQWAFYDGSKNRSGTWCTMAACGNREKLRSYRRRARTPSAV